MTQTLEFDRFRQKLPILYCEILTQSFDYEELFPTLAISNTKDRNRNRDLNKQNGDRTVKQITEAQAKQFKRRYSYKMGGKQTLTFPNGQRFEFNDKEYYSGRGAKYNASIRHEDLGEIKISKKEVSVFFKAERERVAQVREALKERKAREKKYAEAKKQGLYAIEGAFVLLSDEEATSRGFDAERLANTLGISVEDANLLYSVGKTYVYARQSNGNIIELYHPDLSCNYLSISIDFDANEKFAAKQKDRDSWVNAPFAGLVGQSDNINHYVC